jgi:cobalamin synthase
MLAAVAGLLLQAVHPQGLEAQEGEVLVGLLTYRVRLVRRILAEVVVVVLILAQVQQAVRVLSLLLTSAHSVAQAVRLHRQVATQSIPLHRAEHTTLNNLSCSGATFTSSAAV